MRSHHIALGLFLVSSAALGCGGGVSLPPSGSVSGTVKYNGKPLSSGVVTFVHPGGFTGTDMIKPDGKYSVPNAAIGANAITVLVPPPPAGTVVIPKKYADAKTSDLSFEVKAGTQTFDLELK